MTSAIGMSLLLLLLTLTPDPVAARSKKKLHKGQISSLIESLQESLESTENEEHSRLSKVGCGIIKPSISSRVVGGHETSIKQNPWLVQLLGFEGSSITGCGGSIISSTYILTAAHCIQNPDPPFQRFPHNNLRVVVGLSETYDLRNSTHREKYPMQEVEKSFAHPLFVDNTGARLDYDIALLKLKTPLELDDNLTPVCLPDPDAIADNFVGDDCKIAGWGRTDYNNKTEVVRQVSSDIIDEQSCTEYLSKFPKKYRGCKHHYNCSHLLCADNPEVPGQTACSGDSGGPLMCRKGDHWVQAGIVSHGMNKNNPGRFTCNENVGDHTMYVNVAKFMGWIDSIMKNEKVQCRDNQFACKDGSGCVSWCFLNYPFTVCPDFSDRHGCPGALQGRLALQG